MIRSVVPALAVLLAGCSSPEQSQAEQADGLFERFLASRGTDFDECLAALPALLGPGAGATFAGPQAPGGQGADRVILAVDSSGSMAGPAGGETKMEAARRATGDFLSSLPTHVSAGLIAFGHRGNNQEAGKAESCAAVETVHRLGAGDRAALAGSLQSLQPRGWTPLAGAITLAGQSFSPSEQPGRQIVYVVSDGKETCGGDPVAAARALHGGPVKAVVNIVGFDLEPGDREQLRAVAEAGGGSFLEAKTAGDLDRIMGEARRSISNVMAISGQRLQSAHRQTDNNFAVARALRDSNFCTARGFAAENKALQPFLEAEGAAPEVRSAASERLNRRHEEVRQQLTRYTDLAGRRREEANAAIEARRQESERGFEQAR